MKKIYTAILSLMFIASIVIIFIYSSNKKNQNGDKNYISYCKKHYKVFAFPLPDTLYFCGERVPLERIDVRESLDLELLKNVYWHSATFLGLKRANKYLPIIDSILKKNKIPYDFRYLAIVESNLANEVSPAGARGIWQLMPKTAIQYGLEVTDEIDERYHIEKSTEAACLYLKDAYSILKNWTLVAASYNMGVEGLVQQIKNQKTNNYYDLFLNEETSRFVFRILAIKLIFESPQNYGFHFRKKDLYFSTPLKKISIDTTISDLIAFAKSLNISYKTLKIFNPWLRKNSLTNKNKKRYIIEIPIDTTLCIYNIKEFIADDTLYKNE